MYDCRRTRHSVLRIDRLIRKPWDTAQSWHIRLGLLACAILLAASQASVQAQRPPFPEPDLSFPHHPEQLLVRFTIAVKELPELPDSAGTLHPRLRTLVFPNSFEGREDPTLKRRLPAEAAGVAACALEGLKRLRLRGQGHSVGHRGSHFTEPAASASVAQEFRRVVTPLLSFVEDQCVRGLTALPISCDAITCDAQTC